jgi:hypothetical protein
MKKKIFVIVIIIACMLTSTTAAFAADSADADAVDLTEIEQHNQDVWAAIDLMEKYMDVNDDGLVEENVPQKVINVIGEDVYEELSSAIEITNDEVIEGDLIITENLSVYEVNDDEIVIQGGCVNKVLFRWWGFTAYNNKANTTKAASKLKSCSKAGGGVSATASCVTAVLAASGVGAPGTVISGLVAAYSGFASWYWGAVSDSLTSKNNAKGTILDVTYVLAYKVSKQS